MSNLSNSCLYEGECCSRVSAGEAVAVVDIFRHCLAVHDADESNSNDRWGKKAVAEERQYNASSLVALCCLVNDSIISLFCAVSYHTDFIRILSGFYRRTRPGMDHYVKNHGCKKILARRDLFQLLLYFLKIYVLQAGTVMQGSKGVAEMFIIVITLCHKPCKGLKNGMYNIVWHLYCKK